MRLDIIYSMTALLGVVLGVLHVIDKEPNVAWPWFFVSCVSCSSLLMIKDFKRHINEVRNRYENK